VVTSACRSARWAGQRAEEQQRLGERAEELCGRNKQQFASSGGPGHLGGDAVGPGVARGELRSGPGHSGAVVQALGGGGLGEDRAHRIVHRLQTIDHAVSAAVGAGGVVMGGVARRRAAAVQVNLCR
jgi:hypothetical protein